MAAHQALIGLSLMKEVRRWDTDSQIEIDVLLTRLRDHGPNAIYDTPSWCAVEAIRLHPDSGDVVSIDFWYRMRGSWTPFALEVREPDLLILWGRRWP